MPVFKTIWRRRPLLALIVLILLLVIGYAGKAVTSHSEQQGPSPTTSVAVRSDVVALSGLPKQAADTVRLIQRGGPFPFAHDGIVYQNIEHNLPAKPRGYYHEYTVVTPGSDDRGARRIITGKNGEWFYTADHYASFVRVDVTG